MVFEKYPSPGPVRRSYKQIEFDVFQEAERIIVTTPGAAELYKARYSGEGARKVRLIENGYDERLFGHLGTGTFGDGKLSLLHSGVVYRDARNPLPLLQALGKLKEDGLVSKENFELVFRASNQEQFIAGEANRLGLTDLVTTKPAVAYEEAAQEMSSAGALLILQAANCNNQIPAKAYEYLRAGRPILALCHPDGDTGRLLRRYQVKHLCALEDVGAVPEMVARFIREWRSIAVPYATRQQIELLSRRNRALELARVLDETVLAGAQRSSP